MMEQMEIMNFSCWLRWCRGGGVKVGEGGKRGREAYLDEKVR